VRLLEPQDRVRDEFDNKLLRQRLALEHELLRAAAELDVARRRRRRQRARDGARLLDWAALGVGTGSGFRCALELLVLFLLLHGLRVT
jgi:hypothetical protein